MTSNLDDEGPAERLISDAAPDEVLHALQFGMTYQNGKNRSRPANELAIKIVAQMIYEHLNLSGFVIKKKPPSPAHSTSGGYKKHLTD